MTRLPVTLYYQIVEESRREDWADEDEGTEEENEVRKCYCCQKIISGAASSYEGWLQVIVDRYRIPAAVLQCNASPSLHRSMLPVLVSVTVSI